MESSTAMTCEEVVTGEIVEKYLHEQLSEESRDAFEQHYFACDRCFRLLQTYRDLQSQLAATRETVLPAARRSWISQWAWVPAAAALFIAVSLTLWPRPQPVSPPSESLPPSVTPQPAPAPSGPSIEQLAKLEPSPFAPVRLRGASDEATARFRDAMTHYQRRDYTAAIAGLRAASALDGKAPHILFFLGVSQLLTGETDPGIEALERTIALGDSPYLEEAHFYLAKAHLQKRNIDEAIRQLERAIRLGGTRAAEATSLRDQLQAIRRKAG